jgi:23S rRNA pseudouridine1911/1915/1917 synthase
MQEFSLKVEDPDSGMRLDLFLIKKTAEKDLGLSRTTIQKLIRDGYVKVDDRPTRAHYKIKTGELVWLSIQERQSLDLEGENIPLDIVYQDNDLAVINKPSGMVVHPASGNYQHTLANALLYHLKELSHINPERPGIVHRLDKDTSGLIVVARNDQAHLNLSKQFAKHTIKRQYTALVKGSMEFDENVIELPIGRHKRNWDKMSVDFGEKGKYARTHYRTLKRSPEVSLVQLNPFTGRTHQLRVHLDFIGHPILGDSKYGKDNSFSRLALHANYIGFMHPTSLKFMEFSTPIPPEFLDCLNKKP